MRLPRRFGVFHRRTRVTLTGSLLGVTVAEALHDMKNAMRQLADAVVRIF